MFRIPPAEFIAPNICDCGSRPGKKARAGQFLILVRLQEHGERILPTIESAHPADGTISIVVQSVGKTTYQPHGL